MMLLDRRLMEKDGRWSTLRRSSLPVDGAAALVSFVRKEEWLT